MAEIIGISLQQEYQKLMAKVQSMEPYLRLLHQDYLLMTTRSFKFIYAVDFYEIWNYAEPIARLMHTDPKDRPLEDAIALERALHESGDDTATALPAFEAARRPIVEKIVRGAMESAAWYENFAGYMDLAPLDFAMSYIQRSGRVDLERLRKISPQFVARYEARTGREALLAR